MAVGAAGPPGDPALGDKGQGPETAITLHPAEGGATALDHRWSRTLVRMPTCSTYSEGCLFYFLFFFAEGISMKSLK